MDSNFSGQYAASIFMVLLSTTFTLYDEALLTPRPEDPSLTLTHSLTPGRYNPCRVLADSRSRLQPSLSLALILQFLTPSLSASLITPSFHLRFGLPTHLPSGLSKVIFLHSRLSCIRTIYPAHLSLVILIVVTKSVSSYRRYSSSLYRDLHVTPSQIRP